MKLFIVWRIVKQSVLPINAANDMRLIFLNNSKFGKMIFSLRRLKERKMQTINSLNSNLAEFLLLIFGTLTFFVIYFLLTKFLKVNKFKVSKKEI